MDWSLNPYTGCEHACVYCYAHFMKRFSGHEEPWGEFVDAKLNVPQALFRQTRRKKSGRVLVGSVTDAWQPLEREKGLTRACLEILADSGLSVAALTKSDLVVRDIDIFRSFGGLLRDPPASVGLTLTTTSDEVASIIEPNASSPSQRLAALEQLAAAGIETWVFIAPIIPGLTDGDVELSSLAREARRRGALDVQADPLNFYPSSVKAIERVLKNHFPSALPAWREALAAPKDWREHVRRRVAAALS